MNNTPKSSNSAKFTQANNIPNNSSGYNDSQRNGLNAADEFNEPEDSFSDILINPNTGAISPLNDEELVKIEVLSGYGMTIDQIAPLYHMGQIEFEQMAKENPALRSALGAGLSRATARVAETAYEMAVSGKNAQMTMFWLKSKAGWKETQHIEMNLGLASVDLTAAIAEAAGRVKNKVTNVYDVTNYKPSDGQKTMITTHPVVNEEQVQNAANDAVKTANIEALASKEGMSIATAIETLKNASIIDLKAAHGIMPPTNATIEPMPEKAPISVEIEPDKTPIEPSKPMIMSDISKVKPKPLKMYEDLSNANTAVVKKAVKNKKYQEKTKKEKLEKVMKLEKDNFKKINDV